MDVNALGGWLVGMSLLAIAIVGSVGVHRGWTGQQAHALRTRGVEYAPREVGARKVWIAAMAFLFGVALVGVILLNR